MFAPPRIFASGEIEGVGNEMMVGGVVGLNIERIPGAEGAACALTPFGLTAYHGGAAARNGATAGLVMKALPEGDMGAEVNDGAPDGNEKPDGFVLTDGLYVPNPDGGRKNENAGAGAEFAADAGDTVEGVVGRVAGVVAPASAPAEETSLLLMSMTTLSPLSPIVMVPEMLFEEITPVASLIGAGKSPSERSGVFANSGNRSARARAPSTAASTHGSAKETARP